MKYKFLVILVFFPAFVFAQDTLSFNFDWMYDFGSVTYDDICKVYLGDPDSNDVIDLFCVHGENGGDLWKISRLADDQLIWLIEDFEFYPSTMQVIDMNRDGTNTLWLTAGPTFGPDQTIVEINIETGEIIQTNIIQNCYRILSLNSLKMSNSIIYPVTGTYYSNSSIFRLNPQTFQIIEQLPDVDGKVNSIINVQNPSGTEEFLYYTRYYSSIDPYWEEYHAHCGIVNNSFELLQNLQLYSVGMDPMEGIAYGSPPRAIKTNYIYNDFNTIVVTYNYGEGWFGYAENHNITELYSIPDMSLLWQRDDSLSIGSHSFPVDFTGDGIDEIVIFTATYQEDFFSILDASNGDIIGYGEGYYPYSHYRCIIGTIEGCALYLTENEKVWKYSCGYLTVDDDPDELKPNDFTFHPPYPNPFNASTTIEFGILKSASIKLIVYDITGREVAKLVNGTKSAGSHSVKWNAENFTSGIYFARLTANGFTKTQKLLLIK